VFQKGHKSPRLSKEGRSDKMKVLSKNIKKHGKYLEAAQRSIGSRGRDLYVLYIVENMLLSPMQAIIAQCAHCQGWYVDGRHDCENADCPLYLYMPYGKYRKIRKQGKDGQIEQNEQDGQN
jgi:hypothetical protein